MHPTTRAMIRWRAQHVAPAAAELQRGEHTWRFEHLDRYDLYDGRTQVKPTPTPSPRRVMLATHALIDIPAVHTAPFEAGGHTLRLTTTAYQKAHRIIRSRHLFDVWQRYVWTPEPPTVFRRHARDGIITAQDHMLWPGLREAFEVWGFVVSEAELERSLLDELWGNVLA